MHFDFIPAGKGRVKHRKMKLLVSNKKLILLEIKTDKISCTDSLFRKTSRNSKQKNFDGVLFLAKMQVVCYFIEPFDFWNDKSKQTIRFRRL